MKVENLRVAHRRTNSGGKGSAVRPELVQIFEVSSFPMTPIRIRVGPMVFIVGENELGYLARTVLVFCRN